MIDAFVAKKQQILDRVGVLDVVSEQVALKRNGRRFVGLCPFHAEKTPSFTVNPELGLFKCFGCGKGGDVFKFIQYRENISFGEALRLLADRAGVDLGTRSPRGSGSSGQTDRSLMARVNEWAAGYFHEALKDGVRGRSVRGYLSLRAVREEDIERFELGLAAGSESGLREAAGRAGFSVDALVSADIVRRADDGHTYETFRDRLMFPIRDAMNRVIGFGGRTLVEDRAKYLNSRQTALFDKSSVLYGINLARKAMVSTSRAVVVEGYMDCLAAHAAGVEHTVATLGTALTDRHVEALRRYVEEVIVLFDSDRAGAAAADRAIGVALPRCVRVRLARIPGEKDPSSFVQEHGSGAFSDVLNGSIDALEWKWHQTRGKFEEGTSDRHRREAVVEFLGVVSDASHSGAMDAVQRGLLIHQVAHLLRMDPGDVARMMKGRSASGRIAVGNADAGQDRTSRGGSVGSGACGGSPWSTILEAVISEPGVLSTCGALPPMSGITDERDRRIAGLVLELYASMGEFRLADLTSRCEDEADVDRVTALAERGHVRGRPRERLGSALQRLRDLAEVEAMRDGKARLLAGGAGSNDGERSELQGLHSRALERTSRGQGTSRAHFAPIRLLSEQGTAGSTGGSAAAPGRQE